jgi:ATP-dependent protease ClpP protease subunit
VLASALQNGATEIELHMSSEGGNMTAGFALYFCARLREIQTGA